MHFIVLNVSGDIAALPAWRLPSSFPPTNIYGVPTLYDQYSSKQDQEEAYSQFQKVILVCQSFLVTLTH